MISDEIKECEPYLHDVGDAVVIRADLRRGEKYAMSFHHLAHFQ